MKAIRVAATGGPEVLSLEEQPDLAPDPGQVLVSIKAAGVNPVDTYVRSGTQGYAPTLPYTPGSDGAGVVAAAGGGVDKVRPGDRVYLAGSLTGTYAEQALCTEDQLFLLPESIGFAQGAAVNVPYATAYRGLFQRGQAKPAELLLVHGASGGVGLAAVQLAVAAGLTVLGTSGSDGGRELVRAQGAAAVFDHHDPRHFQSIMDLSRGHGVDIILEMLADKNLAEDLPILAPQGGRVVVIGNRGNITINPRETMSRDADIRGMSLKNLGAQDKHRIHAALRAGLVNGSLRPIIRSELPLADAAKAHELVMRSGACGKIVLLP